MVQYTLGRSIARLVPFYRIPIAITKKPIEPITAKMAIVMGIIAIVKIAVLLLLI